MGALPEVVTVRRDSLTLDPQNANKGTKRGREMVRLSLKEMGAGRSILLDKNGVVVAGNKTLEASKGVLPEDVIVIKTDGTQLIAIQRTDLEGDDAVRMGIADNRASQVGLDWDHDVMAILQERKFDFSGLFEPSEVARLLPPVRVVAADNIPDIERRKDEILARFPVEVGDLWRVGPHMIACGDCTDADVVSLAANGEQIPLVITSPPYADQRKGHYNSTSPDDYPGWWALVQDAMKPSLSQNASLFLNIKEHVDNGRRHNYVLKTRLQMEEEWGWMWVEEYYWKNQGIPGYWPGRFKNVIEPIYHFALGPDFFFNVRPYGGNDGIGEKLSQSTATGSGIVSGLDYGGDPLPSNLIDCPSTTPAESASGGNIHPAMFPVALPEFFILAFSERSAHVLDVFGGAGTTLVAAHKTGRVGHAVELDPAYVAGMLMRLENLTGETPERIE